MKNITLISLVSLLLSGCADTPQNRAFWQALGEGMQSGAQNINRSTQQSIQSQNALIEQQQRNRPINCVTTYDGYGRAFTSCN